MFNTLQSTYDTKNYLYLYLQDKMSNPMELLAEMQGDTIYFHQDMSQ